VIEGGGVSVVDNVLAAPSAQKAENKTTLHKWVEGLGYAGLATVSIAVFKSPPAWIVETGAGVAGVATIFDKQLSADEAQVQATIQSALGSLADPTAQFSVSNGACTGSKLFLGAYVNNFVPIKATLPSVAQAVSPTTPNSAVPHATLTLPFDETQPTGEVTMSSYRSQEQDRNDDVATIELLALVAANLGGK
jgi:hypothetical protein